MPGPAPGAPTGSWCTLGLSPAFLAQNVAIAIVVYGIVAVGATSLLSALLGFLLWLLLAAMCRDCEWQPCDGCGDCDCSCPDCGCGDCGDCDCGCGDCGGDCGGCGDCGCVADAPAVALLGGVIVTMSARPAHDQRTAHHPPGPTFEQDVYRIFGRRWCIGCTTTYPVFFAVASALIWWPLGLAWMTQLVLGVALASVQAVSSLGWTHRRWHKAAVKTSLGVGLALALHGVLLAPIGHWAHWAVLMGLLFLARASAIPRAIRLRRHSDACPARHGCQEDVASPTGPDGL